VLRTRRRSSGGVQVLEIYDKRLLLGGYPRGRTGGDILDVNKTENAFLLLKRWRGIAARYAKSASSFVVAVQIRCIAIWLSVC